MKKKYANGLFIFRRDIRIEDNTGFIKALNAADTVIPLFILDPRQLSDQNEYKSERAIQFMAESLMDLHTSLKKYKGHLYLMDGTAQECVKTLLSTIDINAIFCNRDYTPFSRMRDAEIEKLCIQHGIDFHQCNDLLLTEPEQVLTKGNTPYSKFTPFFRCASSIPVQEPQKASTAHLYTATINHCAPISTLQKYIQEPNLYSHGGSSHAHTILKNIIAFKEYAIERNIPSLDKTTHLSAHIKFGTISIRTVYHTIANTLGNTHPLIQQLYWRDFFTHVAFYTPHVFGHAYNKKFEHIRWKQNKQYLQAWQEGRTGFPIVDAGMRQLNQTGFMHNRVRMIVASFLVKDLHINWQEGEQYFAQKLIDYDPCVNNGNWQWCASTGCDAQPYFRIFNPWLQQKKFDPEALYIKKWIPELKNASVQEIHTWHTAYKPTCQYPKPIVDHAAVSAQTKLLFKDVAQSQRNIL